MNLPEFDERPRIEEYTMDTILDFGRYQGQTVRDVIENERPSYIVWAAHTTKRNFDVESMLAAEDAAENKQEEEFDD